MSQNSLKWEATHFEINNKCKFTNLRGAVFDTTGLNCLEVKWGQMGSASWCETFNQNLLGGKSNILSLERMISIK